MFEVVELPAKRKRTSRFVTVDGYQVQKLNMYTLQQGEPSVWDTELGIPHKDDENALEAAPLKAFVKKIAKKEKRQMTVSETTSARYLHNSALKADIEMGVLRRQDFIRGHWKLLAPFLDATSCPSLALNTSHRRCFTPLKTQPACLQNVEMRGYQLAGVNWLIKMYENSVNAILGGENS